MVDFRSRILRSCALAVLFALLASSAAMAQPWRLRGIGDEQLAEGDVGRGATVVVVWASWSPKSRDIVERVNRVVDRWQGKARVVTVTFQEERAAVNGFLAGKSLRAPVFLDTDGTFSRRYAIATLPGLLVLKDGQVAYHGKLPDDPDAVIADLLR